MLFIRRVLRASAITSCIVAISACSMVASKETEYKKSASLPSLEIPPDLIAPAIDDNAIIPGRASGNIAAPIAPAPPASAPATTPQEMQADKPLAPLPENIRVERDGGLRWLVINKDPAQLWPKIRGFLTENGFAVTKEEPRLGILDTDWVENRPGAGKGGPSSFLRKSFELLHSSSTRDTFRVRLESGMTPGTTELYLAHRGMAQVAQGDSINWRPRPSEPELEAEMLKRLALYLGTDETKATEIKNELTGQPAPRATLANDAQGQLILTLQEDYANAWRRTGQALDHMGLKVEDQDRAKGIYQVNFSGSIAQNEEKRGFLSKLFSPDDKKTGTSYQLNLASQGDKETRIIALDMAGGHDNSPMAQRLLTLLHEQLK